VHDGNSKSFLSQVVILTAAPVSPVAGTKLGNIVPLLEFYHVSTTEKSYLTVAQTVSKEDKLAKVLKELKFDDMFKGHPAERAGMRKLIEKYLGAFAADDSDMGKVSLNEHVVNTGETIPSKCRQRQYSAEHEKAIEEEIGKCEQIGVVRPSTSPWASPTVTVKKKHGLSRLCVDYRR
jgi:hypothetical protein